MPSPDSFALHCPPVVANHSLTPYAMGETDAEDRLMGLAVLPHIPKSCHHPGGMATPLTPDHSPPDLSSSLLYFSNLEPHLSLSDHKLLTLPTLS